MDAYARKVISDQQWDYGIIPALQVKGYLAAADVGVGKTRIAAAVAAEWLETGVAKRVLYLTASEVNIQDVKREFDLYAGGKFPHEILEVSSFKDASERPGKRSEYSSLPVQDGVYLVDRYNFSAYRRALGEVGFDAIIGDEAHLVKNVDAQVGKAWMDIQRRTLAADGRFLYLTATPAVDFDDLAHLIGLREWHPDGFLDYKARVTGCAPSGERPGQTFAAASDRLLALMNRPDVNLDFYQWERDHLDEPKPFSTKEQREEIATDNLQKIEDEIARIEREHPEATAGSDAGDVGVTAGASG